MLVLSRKANQSIMIGNDIRIMIVGVDRDQVKIGIEAPRDVPVHRSEIFSEVQRTQGSIAELDGAVPVGKTRAETDTLRDAGGR